MPANEPRWHVGTTPAMVGNQPVIRYFTLDAHPQSWKITRLDGEARKENHPFLWVSLPSATGPARWMVTQLIDLPNPLLDPLLKKRGALPD